jgi:hypothetical protein
MDTELRIVVVVVAVAGPLRDLASMSWDKIVYRVSQAIRINLPLRNPVSQTVH